MIIWGGGGGDVFFFVYLKQTTPEFCKLVM